MVDVSITGAEEMTKTIKKLSEKISTKIVRSAIRKGAKVISEEAKRNVPVDTGNLKLSISVVKRKSKNKKIVHYSVVPKGALIKRKRLTASNGEKITIKGRVASGNHAHLIEFGTSTMAAQPFLRPAESKSQAAFIVAKKSMSKAMEKELKKVKK